MKKLFSIASAVILISCIGSNLYAGTESSTEVRTSDPYHAIIMLGDAELILTPSDKFEITLEGTKDQVMNMSTLLRNDTLFITQVNKKDRNKSRTRIQVGVDELTSIHAKGNTSVIARGYINTDILKLHAEDGAVVNLDVKSSN